MAILCPWCNREVRIRPSDGVLFKHDNRNHSGFCKGSFMPASSGSDEVSNGQGQ